MNSSDMSVDELEAKLRMGMLPPGEWQRLFAELVALARHAEQYREALERVVAADDALEVLRMRSALRAALAASPDRAT